MRNLKRPADLVATTNGKKVSVKYTVESKEHLIHYFPVKTQRYKISPGYVPHHMKNLKRACKLFMEQYAYPIFEKGGRGMFDSPSTREWSDLFQKDTKKKKMQKLLKILFIGKIETAKNGRNYRVVRFESHATIPDGTPVFSNLSEGTRTIWDNFQDKDGNIFKADGLWGAIESGAAKIGSYVEGQIMRVSTYPYQIEGSTSPAKSWTGIVFGHEDPTAYINKQLKPNFSCVMYGDNLTEPDQIRRSDSTTGAPATSAL